VFGDLMAVRGPEQQSAEDEHVERPLQKLDAAG
jgi:hypothetical protein